MMVSLSDVRSNVLLTTLRLSLALSVTGLCLACQEATTPDDGDGALVALEIVSGDGQAGPVGQELPDPLVVRALDARGKRIKNHLVNFRVTTGGGTMFAGASLTNKDGIAQDFWTLGPTPGENVVEVRSVDATTGEKQVFARFTAAGIPRSPACFTFSGFLTQVVDTQNTLEFPYAIGDPFTGIFSYPLDLIDGNPDPTWFNGPDSRVVASVTLTAHVFTGGSNGEVVINSNAGQMSVSNRTTSINPLPQFLISTYVQVLFKGRIIPFNDMLPTTLSLSDFQDPVQMAMAGANTQGGNGIALRGNIDVLSQVPEPPPPGSCGEE